MTVAKVDLQSVAEVPANIEKPAEVAISYLSKNNHFGDYQDKYASESMGLAGLTLEGLNLVDGLECKRAAITKIHKDR